MHSDKIDKLIAENRDQSFFFGNVDETIVRKVEEKLELTFPPQYRKFITEYGCGNIGPIEIFGLGPEEESVPNLEWVIKDLRQTRNLPEYLIPIENIGDGSYAVLSSQYASENEVGEGDVLEWNSRARDPKRIANSFGEYLQDRLLNL